MLSDCDIPEGRSSDDVSAIIRMIGDPVTFLAGKRESLTIIHTIARQLRCEPPQIMEALTALQNRIEVLSLTAEQLRKQISDAENHTT